MNEETKATKLCRQCKKQKPADDFYLEPNSQWCEPGEDGTCGQCYRTNDYIATQGRLHGGRY